MERTELVFILDRSGSMAGLEKQTIDGFNDVVSKQAKEPGQAYITTVLFDNVFEALYESKPIQEVSLLTHKEYYVRGCTALLDAIGYSMKAMNKKRKKVHIDHVIFVIATDGYENASQKYTYDKISYKIKNHQEKHGWEFIFLGAGEDAIKEACNIGIKESNIAKIVGDEQGIELSYDATASFIRCSRLNKDTSKWNAKANEDYRKRGK